MKPLMDERNYAVTGPNGYRRGNLTLDQARRHAADLREQMALAGWRGEARIIYRDGSEVKDK